MVENRAKIEDLMNDAEKAAFCKFLNKHKRCSFDSTIGGKISVKITSTGLGYTFMVMCNACGAKKNITDVTCW